MPSHLGFINEIRKRKGESQYSMQDMNKMIESTDFFFYSMDSYFYNEACVPGIRFAIDYGFTDQQAENFGIYCMLAAYNNGPTRLKQVLESFKKVSPPEKIKGNYILNPLTFFHRIAIWAEVNNVVSGYKKESSEYVFRVLAGAEFLGHEKLHALISDLKDGSIKKTPEYVARQEYDALLQNVEDYATTGAIGAAAAASTFIGKKITDEKPIDRRGFFKKLPVVATVGAVGAMAVKNLIDNPPSLGSLKFSWWRKEDFGVETKYKDGSVFSPIRVAQKFSRLDPKLFLPKSALQRISLPVRNYTSTVKSELLRMATQFPPITEAKLTELDQKMDSKYSRVEEVNDNWRLRGVGSGAVNTHINTMKYAIVVKETEILLKDAMAKFQSEVKLAGIPAEWFIRPVVNALTRTQDGTNKQVVGASNISAHTNGLAFDISDSRFDVGFEEGGIKYFTELSRLTESNITNTQITEKLRTIWSKVLTELASEDRLIITNEPKARHMHVTTKIK